MHVCGKDRLLILLHLLTCLHLLDTLNYAFKSRQALELVEQIFLRESECHDDEIGVSAPGTLQVGGRGWCTAATPLGCSGGLASFATVEERVPHEVRNGVAAQS